VSTPGKTHADTADRWQAALDRSIEDGVILYEGTDGHLYASSATSGGVLYRLYVVGNIAFGCDCQAGQNMDPVCKHRAGFYREVGALSHHVDQVVNAACPDCHGGGIRYSRDCEMFHFPYPTCGTCNGRGVVRQEV
jgi:hypothetical protein